MYKDFINKISDELSELMAERQNLYKQGISAGDIEQAIKNLLGSDIIAVFGRTRISPPGWSGGY